MKRKKVWQEGDTNRKTNGEMKECAYATKVNSVVFTNERGFAIGYCD